LNLLNYLEIPQFFLYAQVIKKRRNNRVSQINRKVIIGSKEKIEEFLNNSEDSNTINTSFIERLNLTIRRGCSYLNRKTPGFAKNKDYLAGSLELLRCFYNFIRPHRGLKFGKTTRTPAMQAGLTERALNFEDIFSELLLIFWFKILIPNFTFLKQKNILRKIAA